jgi:hypothetical protein
MKIKIGPYKSWFGPYQLADLLCFWAPKVRDKYGFRDNPYWVHTFGEWLAHGNAPKSNDLFDERRTTWLLKVMSWAENKRKRKISIHIDKYDTWGMDHTLSYIILPMLIQLKESKHGAPYVEDEDVPYLIKKSNAPTLENEWDADKYHFMRWNWVLNEMIWAFGQKDKDWEDQYWTSYGKSHVEEIDNGSHQIVRDEEPIVRRDLIEAHQKRITNGFRLFGKYYENLWD